MGSRKAVTTEKISKYERAVHYTQAYFDLPDGSPLEVTCKAMDEVLLIINNEFDGEDEDDTLFAISLARRIWTDRSNDLSHMMLKEFRRFYETYQCAVLEGCPIDHRAGKCVRELLEGEDSRQRVADILSGFFEE